MCGSLVRFKQAPEGQHAEPDNRITECMRASVIPLLVLGKIGHIAAGFTSAGCVDWLHLDHYPQYFSSFTYVIKLFYSLRAF